MKLKNAKGRGLEMISVREDGQLETTFKPI